jgi:hypothetical protein
MKLWLLGMGAARVRQLLEHHMAESTRRGIMLNEYTPFYPAWVAADTETGPEEWRDRLVKLAERQYWDGKFSLWEMALRSIVKEYPLDVPGETFESFADDYQYKGAEYHNRVISNTLSKIKHVTRLNAAFLGKTPMETDKCLTVIAAFMARKLFGADKINANHVMRTPAAACAELAAWIMHEPLQRAVDTAIKLWMYVQHCVDRNVFERTWPAEEKSALGERLALMEQHCKTPDVAEEAVLKSLVARYWYIVDPDCPIEL